MIVFHSTGKKFDYASSSALFWNSSKFLSLSLSYRVGNWHHHIIALMHLIAVKLNCIHYFTLYCGKWDVECEKWIQFLKKRTARESVSLFHSMQLIIKQSANCNQDLFQRLHLSFIFWTLKHRCVSSFNHTRKRENGIFTLLKIKCWSLKKTLRSVNYRIVGCYFLLVQSLRSSFIQNHLV